jgi:hypothetical protein
MKLVEAMGKLSQTVSLFIEHIRSLPKSELEPADWGLREILIHIVFWHENYLNNLQRIRDKKPLHMLEGTYRELNAAAIRENESETIEHLLKRFENVQNLIVEIVSGTIDTGLDFYFKSDAKPRSILESIIRIEQHVRSHLVKMKKK